jgi:hypothetical protein
MTRQGRKISSSGMLNESVEAIINYLEEKICLGASK